jgi:hypothetical protein
MKTFGRSVVTSAAALLAVCAFSVAHADTPTVSGGDSVAQYDAPAALVSELPAEALSCKKGGAGCSRDSECCSGTCSRQTLALDFCAY